MKTCSMTLPTSQSIKVVNDERPDQVGYKIYGTQDYDWIVLLSNNIVNVQSEWPLSNESFEKYMFDKYGSEDKFL